jgi:26S proteasome regulatory subunit N9
MLRLWHQLTERVQAFFAEPAAKPMLPTIFSHFVVEWHKKMNPLVFVKLAVAASRQLPPQEAKQLMEGIVDKVKQIPKPEGPTLLVLATMELAQYSLNNGDLVATKDAVDHCSAAVESFVGVDPTIAAAFYRVSSEYHKATSNFDAFYKNALLYFTCVKLENVPLDAARERAHDLCIAALLGDSIYNFGELLSHPVLLSLQQTPLSYLNDLLLAFNSGNHDAFAKLLPTIAKHPALTGAVEKLQQKMFLMSLIENVFCQLKSSRVLPFSIVSQATRVPMEQVEFLLMKALSLKLIRGSINEPEKCFVIEWVQPRYLDIQQISELRAGIQAWRWRVQETTQLIHSLVPEQLASSSLM